MSIRGITKLVVGIGVVVLVVATTSYYLHEDPATYHRRELLRIQLLMDSIPVDPWWDPQLDQNRSLRRSLRAQYREHREALLRMGEIKHSSVRLYQIRTNTPESEHLSDVLLYAHYPNSPVPPFIGTLTWSLKGQVFEIEDLWHFSEHTGAWQAFLDSRNVTDYAGKFITTSPDDGSVGQLTK